ncbi:hypothetical protein LEMLEM_LOCUS27507 [Lemmus lemmus]
MPSSTPGATRWRPGQGGPTAAVSRAQIGPMVHKHQQVHGEALQQQFEETPKPQETLQLYQIYPIERHSTSSLEHHELHHCKTPANLKYWNHWGSHSKPPPLTPAWTLTSRGLAGIWLPTDPFRR